VKLTAEKVKVERTARRLRRGTRLGTELNS